MSLHNETHVNNDDACKECGACCRYLFSKIDIPILEEDLEDVLDYHRRLGVTVYRYGQQGQHYGLKVPCLCSCLDEETGLCTDYENRPSVCKVFPGHYQPVMAPYCQLMRKMRLEGKI